ncbi:hypothetical protein [Bacillus wiedmannii]|uniref:hypothetical protein n=1 Tax=Bacillus wiedmannii TaxID=1890302 RepID=UPI001E38BA55|nr:hypothetical protein [Bacillus wiedmannii]
MTNQYLELNGTKCEHGLHRDSLLIYDRLYRKKKEANIRPQKIVMNETKEFSLLTDGNSSPPELLGFTHNTNQMESSYRKG